MVNAEDRTGFLGYTSFHFYMTWGKLHNWAIGKNKPKQNQNPKKQNKIKPSPAPKGQSEVNFPTQSLQKFKEQRFPLEMPFIQGTQGLSTLSMGERHFSTLNQWLFWKPHIISVISQAPAFICYFAGTLAAKSDTDF